MSEADLPSPPAGWLGWAFYLGVSWTWCIGMFLPILLIRDFGNLGWWIFAVPNVIGAAAMGWVIRSPQQSEAMTIHHRFACEVFSAVTIAFHVYFVATIVPLIVHRTGLPLITSAVTTIVSFLMFWKLADMKRWAAAAIWIISIAIAIGFGVSRTGGRIAIGILDLRPADYVALTLVCLLGFATCPYLDLTFHRARQFSSAPRRSFGVGFGIVFLTMILFTYVYAHSVWMALPPLLIAGMATHLILQSGFTVAAHANELRTSRLAWVLVVVLVGLSVPLVIVAPTARAASELPLWELGYRTFMGFYGLIFPAYVWLVMMPRAPLDKKWLIFFAAVLAAFPAYGVGFLLRDYKWLFIGVAMVVLPRVFLLSRRRKYADA